MEFGTKVMHKASGFVGTVTARASYQNGDESVRIEGIDSTGRPIVEWENVKDVVVVQ
jgi:hypothetical protein